MGGGRLQQAPAPRFHPERKEHSRREAVRTASEIRRRSGVVLLDRLLLSLGRFETREQGEESSKLVRSWIHDEKLETLMPNQPKVTSGKIIAQSGLAVA
jgi:hypothetical protein